MHKVIAIGLSLNLGIGFQTNAVTQIDISFMLYHSVSYLCACVDEGIGLRVV